MKHTWYRNYLAVLLCVCLLAGLMPPVARAADQGVVLTIFPQVLDITDYDTVYQLYATVTAAYDETSGGVYVGDVGHAPSPGGGMDQLLVEPRTEDSGLRGARPGDTVRIQGKLAPNHHMILAENAEVWENPCAGVENGGVIHWTTGGELWIPDNITKLTVVGDGRPMQGEIVAGPSHPGLDLTIRDLHIDGWDPIDNRVSTPITLYRGPSKLTVEGACSLNGIHGIDIRSSLYLELAEGASLTAEGIVAFKNLSISIARDARLTVTPSKVYEVGVLVDGSSISIHNDGVVKILGGDGNYTSTGSGGIAMIHGELVFSGSGTTWLFGTDKSSAVCFSGGSTKLVDIQSGHVVIAGGDKGIKNSTSVTIGPNVTGLIADGVDGTLTDNSNGGVQFVNPSQNTDPSKPLNLSSVTNPIAWFFREGGAENGTLLGMAAWTPADGSTPARFTLVSMDQSPSGDLTLSGGVVFPASTAVEIAMSANTRISNDGGPAVSAPGGRLTFTTSYMGESAQPSLYAGEGQVAISAAPDGSVSFAGGNFKVFGGDGAADVPIRVEKGLSTVMLSSETNPAAPEGVTVDPAVVSRAGTADQHAELTGQTVSHLPGSPSNYAISYKGGDTRLVVSILRTRLSEPTPAPAPAPSTGTVSESRETTYAVVYHPGYDGPRNVREGGHSRGDRVTVQANPFDAPRGMEFAGWSGEEGGAVLCQPGERLSMPYNDLHLYAVWSETAAPSLNRAEHMAYLTGYPNGNAGPADLITREQTAVIFYRLLDAASRAQYHSASSPFPDVADSRWSGAAIATMANAGILRGLPDGTFAPEAPITRGEFAAIAARFDSDGYSGVHLFPDIAGHWAAGEIDRAAQKGWVKGDQAGNFRPDAPITRAEAAALINRVLERAPQTAGDLLTGMKVFPDNGDPAAWYYLDIQEAANGHEFQRKPDGVHETWTELTSDDF